MAKPIITGLLKSYGLFPNLVVSENEPCVTLEEQLKSVDTFKDFLAVIRQVIKQARNDNKVKNLLNNTIQQIRTDYGSIEIEHRIDQLLRSTDDKKISEFLPKASVERYLQDRLH